MAIIKPQGFWNWLRWKMLQTWPRRNYLRGGLGLVDYIRTPTMNRYIDFYHEHTEAIAERRLRSERVEVYMVDGMYDDEEGFADNTQIAKKAIMDDVLNEVVLQDEQVQKIDLALEKIMKNGNGHGNKKSDVNANVNVDVDTTNDDDQYDGNYDGNEWDE